MVLKDKKTKITFHSGVLTIGGTIIEVRYEDARIFFDFGSEFNPELKLEKEDYQSLIAHNLIPHLDNVYHATLTGQAVDGHNTAVFISHCHLDHTRIMNYVDPQIPVYALEDTKILLESLNENGTFLLPGPIDANTREIKGMQRGSHVKIGQIAVTLLPVDHDAYGACGLIIQTPDLKIAYTGDLRLHGFDGADSLAFCEAANGADVLIIEGVSISFDRPEPVIKSEAALIEALVKCVHDNKGKQVTFNTYPGNVKRLAAIVEASPRPVVLEASYAHILKSCLNMDVDYYTLDGRHYGLDQGREVAYQTLLQDSENYLWQVVNNHDKLKGGGAYIHSDATPLGDFDPRYQPFLDLLDNNNIKFERISCTGHAYPEDLDTIVGLISPKILVPIHSYHPERLENKNGARHLPIRGETI